MAAAALAAADDPNTVRQREERVRQQNELMHLKFWEQIYTSRLGPEVLRDLLALPGLGSPAARDVAMVHDTETGERELRLAGHVDFVHDVAFLTQPVAAKNGGGVGGGGGSGGGGGGVATVEAGAEGSGRGGGCGAESAESGGRGRRRATQLVTAGSDRTIRFWDFVTGEELACLRDQAGRLTALAVSHDGAHLASADKDGAVYTWRLAPPVGPPGTELLHRGCHHADRSAAFCLAFSPADAGGGSGGGSAATVLASGGRDGCVRLWDVVSGAQVNALAVSPDGRALYSCSCDNTVR
ncbi:hypothetical protein GPECTOR_26g549 [Gonium pectorale]|uniref:Uncharacterized protein n=1 Tax=Gonium pectorale TaxID=33097 RepID=A0A150GFP0_GONPE|nr:hypothetical protein GPECTOR_26g549 [Gonium pectorale]|eukprot:KXZ48646.1 hypothetical protein GPECTOR_26g549 [Gonium pectorale]